MEGCAAEVLRNAQGSRRHLRRKVRGAGIWIGAITVALAVVVFARGYWHVSTHGDVHVALWDVALKTDRQLYGSLAAADVVFRDEAGTDLAIARADKPSGLVSMIHPTVGDCRQEERTGGDAWRRCYETQSRWFSTWTPQVRTAQVSIERCTIERVPVEVEESTGEWWL